jgi:hypothetical protein
MISLRMDRPLRAGTRASIYLHRLACEFCRNCERHFGLIRDASREFQLHLHELRDDDRLPASARARIKEAILQNS